METSGSAFSEFARGSNIMLCLFTEISGRTWRMHASRLIDEMRYDLALNEFESLFSHKDEIMPLYVKEIACELVFLYLHAGKTTEAESILDKDLKKYIETYRKMMSSKERILYAIVIYLEKDMEKANSIYCNFKAGINEYLLQGEALSDLAIMDDIKANGMTQ